MVTGGTHRESIYMTSSLCISVLLTLFLPRLADYKPAYLHLSIHDALPNLPSHYLGLDRRLAQVFAAQVSHHCNDGTIIS